jgi:hypothetical protein
MTVTLRRAQVRALVAAVLGLVALISLSLGAYVLGRANTPHDRAGKPLVLRPSLVAARDYQVQAVGWLRRLESLDARSRSVLQGAGGDLYTAATSADSLVSDLGALADDITLAEPPPALAALQETLLTTTSAYLDTAHRIGGWIAHPNSALQADAARSLVQSRAYLAALEDSPWLTNR